MFEFVSLGYDNMIKALLIITALGGDGNYIKDMNDHILLESNPPLVIDMPSMKSCLQAKKSIAKQDSTIKTLCVPRVDEDGNKFKEYFNNFNEEFDARTERFYRTFMDLLDQLKERMEFNDDLRLNK
jgi:hypothetical protein